MRPLPLLSVIAGCATMLAGAVIALTAAVGDYADVAARLRTAVRLTHAGTGAGVMLAGLAFVLAGHVLEVLRDIAAAAQTPRRAPDRAAPQTLAPRAPEPRLPDAGALRATHGEQIGSRMHTEMAAAQARGTTITMEQARARALEWMRRNGAG